MANAGAIMLWTMIVMSTLAGVGVITGYIIAKVRMNRFMKVFNEK